CFATIHFIAINRGLRVVPESEMPSWASVRAPRRTLPIIGAFGALLYGILTGRSVQTAAFFGVLGLFVPYLLLNVRSLADLKQSLGVIVNSLEDAGKALVMIGVLLAGAQILVSMVNLTGFGVTLSTLLVAIAGGAGRLVALVTAAVCLV